MRNLWAEAFERDLRSMACADDRHDNCSHLAGAVAGLNPRRLRLEAGLTICKCLCHTSCPVASSRMAVSTADWEGRCSCPGAAAERSVRERAAGGRESIRTALQATWAQTRGRSDPEVHDVLITELEARGLDVPPDRALDVCVAMITGRELPGTTLLGRSLNKLARHLMTWDH